MVNERVAELEGLYKQALRDLKTAVATLTGAGWTLAPGAEAWKPPISDEFAKLRAVADAAWAFMEDDLDDPEYVRHLEEALKAAGYGQEGGE